MDADTPEEMEQYMKNVDEEEWDEEVENKEEENVVASMDKGRKATGAIAIVEIEGKQVKALVDSGACITIIAKSWIQHLGLKRFMDKRATIPQGLRGVSGEYLRIEGKINLRIRIGKKLVEQQAWVAEKAVVPLILGNDMHIGKSVIDCVWSVWVYEEEEVPIQLEQTRLIGAVRTVVAAEKIRIPSWAGIWGIGRIVDEGGDNCERRTVEMIGLKWGQIGVQIGSGIMETYIRKDNQGVKKEEVKIEIINKGDVACRRGGVIIMILRV